MKKVIHLLSSKSFSGAENVATTIINNMRSMIEGYYCSPSGPIEKILKDRNVRYIPVKKLSIVQIKKMISTNKPDIIHAHDYRATILATASSKRITVISHIHQRKNSMSRVSVQSIVFLLLSRRIKKIIWVSQDAYDSYIFKNRIKKKSIVLKNVVDAKYIEKKSREGSPKKADLIFLGRMTEVKNPLFFARVLKRISRINECISAYLVGEGELRKKVEEYISDNGIKNVKIMGYKENPYPYLRSSKILVMTSKSEGLPMVVMEAQSLGKPVISTRVGDIEKLIKDDKNGYITNNIEKMSEKILEFLDEQKYSILKRNSKMEFKKNNKINDYIGVIKRIYYE